MRVSVGSGRNDQGKRWDLGALLRTLVGARLAGAKRQRGRLPPASTPDGTKPSRRPTPNDSHHCGQLPGAMDALPAGASTATPEWMATQQVRGGTLGLVALLGAGALVQCNEATPCRGTLSFADRSITGEGPDRRQARAQACSNYCVEHDALVDGKFRVWRAAGGKGAGTRAEAIQSVPALKRYFDACTGRCAKEAKDVEYVGCGQP